MDEIARLLWGKTRRSVVVIVQPHNEGDTNAELIFDNTGTHYASQETDFQSLGHSIQSDADASLAGELHLFNPSSTTYVKHFYIRTQYYQSSSSAYATYPAGYINDTTAYK